MKVRGINIGSLKRRLTAAIEEMKNPPIGTKASYFDPIMTQARMDECYGFVRALDETAEEIKKRIEKIGLGEGTKNKIIRIIEEELIK